MKDKKQKPTKDSFIEYYILWPIQDLGEELVSAIKWVWRRMSGAWWCEHCETYHGRRVHKFLYKPTIVDKVACALSARCAEDKHMCSLGRDAKWNTESSPLEDLRTAKAKIEARVKSTHGYPPNIFPTPDKPCPEYNNEDLAN